VYNDLNEEVVNFFKAIRNPKMARRLIAALKATPYSRHEFNRAYKSATHTDRTGAEASHTIIYEFQR